MFDEIQLARAMPYPPALADLLAEAEVALAGDLDSCRAALAAAAALLNLPGETAEPAGALAPWQRQRLLDLIDARLESGVGLEDLAIAVGLSSSYLCRAFRATFAQSPHAFVVARRLERARQLMTETGDPLSQIASACGFSDQAHLCRLFSRAHGQPPHRWRLQQRGG